MVRFDIDLNFVFEAITFQEAINCRRIAIILMLGWLMRLRLDQNGAIETDLMLMLDNHRHESTDLIHLVADVGVEQRVVSFAASPQYVVRAAKAMGGIHHRAHLMCGPCEHFWIGIG